jgi:hypothetical protein
MSSVVIARDSSPCRSIAGPDHLALQHGRAEIDLVLEQHDGRIVLRRAVDAMRIAVDDLAIPDRHIAEADRRRYQSAPARRTCSASSLIGSPPGA